MRSGRACPASARPSRQSAADASLMRSSTRGGSTRFHIAVVLSVDKGDRSLLPEGSSLKCFAARPMTEVLDPALIIEAAQQAATAADFVEAERLLREAAALQEARLGSLHPDLASTLNNLALVCERTNKIDEAERLYRRARAIAV